MENNNIMSDIARLYQDINRLEVKKIKREYNSKLVLYFMCFFVMTLFMIAALASQ